MNARPDAVAGGAARRASFYRRRGKRWLDLALLALAAPLALPVIGALVLLVRSVLGRPALFRQTRPGQGGAPFELLKLRTMREGVDARGRPLPDAERLTPIGAWLRRTSLDELPQLWNVLRGEMSLVGPRPLLAAYLDRYTPEEARRHDVRPGLTGWTQVNGRNALCWERKLALDVWYADHASLWLDLRILARTASIVLLRHGISAAGHATMPELRAPALDAPAERAAAAPAAVGEARGEGACEGEGGEIQSAAGAAGVVRGA